MLEGIIEKYNKIKLEIVEKFAGSEDQLYEETGFLDDGEIEKQVNRLKTEYSAISSEAAMLASRDMTDDIKKNVLKLIEQKNEKLAVLVFLASNNIEKVDELLNFVDSETFTFKKCLLGLREYRLGNYDCAYKYLTEHFNVDKTFGRHFLLNKVYGQLLLQNNDFLAAKDFLRFASAIRPEDVSVHKKLLMVYGKLGNETGEQVEKEIIELLEA